MATTIKTGMAVLLSVAALSLIAADEKQAGKAGPKNAGFEKIKALSGEWEVVRGPDGHGRQVGTVTYKVTAAGSAVLETLLAGTDQEMITLYYMDGEDLKLTHYCILHNRPIMRAERPLNTDKIVFKCQEGDNAKIENEAHMHQVTFTFVDPDHLKTTWALYNSSNNPDSTHTFELARKKK